MKHLFPVFLFLLLVRSLSAQPQPCFYAGFEGHSEGYGERYVLPNTFTSKGQPLTIFVYEPGVVGKAGRFTWFNGYPGLGYPAETIYSPEKGSLSFWVKKTGPFFINRYYPNIWGLGCGQRDEINEHPLVLVALNDERAGKINDGQWHHLVLTWNLAEKKRRQYLDGQLLAEGEYRRVYQPASLIFGYRMVGLMDEIAVFKEVLTEKEVASAYQSYLHGQRVFLLPHPAERFYPALPLAISHLPEARPELPAGTDWNLKPARENEKRVRYHLDGYWRFQPAVMEKQGSTIVNPGYFGENWAYISVPGLWKDKNGVVDEKGKLVPNWKGLAWGKISSVWYERDFSLPARDRGSQVLLIFPELRGNAEIYLNSQPIFTSELSGEVKINLTEHLLWGQSNRLTVLAGLPFVSEMDVNGLARTPFLEVRKTRSFDLGEPLICPSVRTRTLRVIVPVENLTYQELALMVGGRILSYRENNLVKSLPPVPLKVEKLFRGEKTLSFPADGLKLWSPEEPVLYKLVLEVGAGKNLLDVTFPEVFGYREIWTENGQIMMNGSKLSIRGKSHNYLSSYGFTREEILRLKQTGQNADRTLSPCFPYIDSLAVTDEEGWLVFFQAPGVNLADLEATRYEWKKMVKTVGNHPSVVAWQWSGNGYLNGPHGHPKQIGGLVSPEVRESDENYRCARVVKELDPGGRPVFYYRLGTGGDFRGIMTTLGFGTPLQDVEEWVSEWASTRQDPLVPTEMQVFPVHHEGFLWQRGSKEIVLLEHYARFFGDQAYLKLTPAHLESYASADKGVSLWLGPDSDYKNDIYALAYGRFLPSWRTFGISGYLFHVFFKTSELFCGDRLNKFGETLKRVNAPVLFYIGGPQSDFVSKGHSYWCGQSVEKSLITVNESFHLLRARVNWRAVAETGEILGTGIAEISVKPGETDFQKVKFGTEGLKKRTGVRIEAVLTAENLELKDVFPVTVLPREEVKVKPIVAVIDATGETVKVLEKMGVAFQVFDQATIDAGQWSWQRFPLLIIGKNSYPAAVKLFKEQLPFGDAVRDGLKVIVLEQRTRHVAGLKLENTNSRQVFIRDRTSPLFAGLENQDFSDWHGESYLLPAYLGWHPESDPLGDGASKHGQLNSFGQRRFWHWSNKGMVATFAFEKPQVGSFRVLADCGFDLLYTALVEFQEGKGRVLFNQLDLVDHYEEEPVARLLLQRMISQYLQPVPGRQEKLGFLGGNRGKALLEQLGVVYQEGWQSGVTYLDLEEVRATVPAETIARYVSGGGTLLISLKSEAGGLMLPVKVKIEKRKLSRVVFPQDPIFAGLGPSEFFYRWPLEVVQVISVNGQPVQDGVAGVIPYGEGKIVYLQLEPGMMENMWARSKVLRIYSTLLANLGVESRLRVDMTAVTGYGLAEEWLPGYTVAVKDLDRRPVLARSQFYLEPALNFDPDQHHVW